MSLIAKHLKRNMTAVATLTSVLACFLVGSTGHAQDDDDRDESVQRYSDAYCSVQRSGGGSYREDARDHDGRRLQNTARLSDSGYSRRGNDERLRDGIVGNVMREGRLEDGITVSREFVDNGDSPTRFTVYDSQGSVLAYAESPGEPNRMADGRTPATTIQFDYNGTSYTLLCE